MKPGSATRPFFGIDADVVDEQGKPVPPGEEGYLVIKKPWPGMLRTIYKTRSGTRSSIGASLATCTRPATRPAKIKDGYIWIIGRMDDVIKVSGYRLGTAEVESALVSHPSVAEAAAIGLPHELKGNAIHTYVILRAGVEKSDKLAEELRNHVAHEIGPIAKPERHHLCGQPAQDAQREDHAPPAASACPGPAGRRLQHAGGVKRDA